MGSFLVASRSNSERSVSLNFPALVAALFRLKRAHWKYSVYFIISFGGEDFEDLEGETKVYALNLTRLMDGSSECPIPDEVLHQQQIFKESQVSKNSTCYGCIQGVGSGSGSVSPAFPRISIKHHNGGPVKWSSFRSGMFVVGKEILYLEEQLRMRGFESDVDNTKSSGEPLFMSSFSLISLSPYSTLVIGKFSVVMEIVDAVRFMFADGSEVVVFSFSGYAEWTYAQLLREVARGSWGVVSRDIAAIACDEFMNPSHITTSFSYPSVDELKAVPRVASSYMNEKQVVIDSVQDEQEVESNNDKIYDEEGEGEKISGGEKYDNESEDELPPLPKPVRMASRGSSTRGRSASTTLAALDVNNSDSSDVKQYQGHGEQSYNWREMFVGIDEGNIWDKMIEISIESGDNIIRQSYT